ncbi:hypothetical protein K2P96_01610, partial [Patescibacteria group bacterium]|nr:hypothetical protein [Patescibacteria group bacterium]
AYFFFYLQTHSGWHFVDAVDLVLHEAGHTIFSFFGQFIYVFAGSFFQIAFPIVFVYYFYLRRQYFSASLMLFWVGQNIVNVSVYAADAVATQLPLLGGDTSGHDWHYLLSQLHALQYTTEVSSVMLFVGACVILSAAVLSILTSQQSK